MYFVYLLKSDKNGDIYIGSTENIQNRIKQHNSGKVKSTRFYKPWELLEYRTFQTRSEAVKHEMFLKTSQQRELLKRKYGAVPE